MDDDDASMASLSLYDEKHYYEEQDNNEQGCDESRCVSRGRTNHYNKSFTCYGDDGTYFPRMCADGFLPVVVEDEPTWMSARLWNTPRLMPLETTTWDFHNEVPVRYFTCCPSQHPAVIVGNDVRRRCSDPTVPRLDATTTARATCDDHRNDTDGGSASARVHPRWMKPHATTWLPDDDSSLENSFICCDEPHETDDESNRTAYIEETQCVPYRNDYYDPSKTPHNRVGGYLYLDRHFKSCDFSGGDFPVVSSFSGEGDNGPMSAEVMAPLYQCCRDGPAIQSIWVRDSAFWISYVTTLPFFVIATVVSIVVFLGLLIPLLRQLTKGSHQTASLQTRNQAPTRCAETPYSPYNLYLVHLAFWDLLSHEMTAFYIGMILTGKHRYTEVYIMVYWTYILANVWINAFIVHQVLILLQHSREARRIAPVSLARVNLECVVAVIIVLAAGACRFSFADPFCYGVLIAMIPPILYVVYATVLIWKRKYLPWKLRPGARSTACERASRELAIYFLRIVAIFFGIWIPVFAMLFIAFAMNRLWINIPGLCLAASQPVFTFVAILHKSDVKRYILDLLTLSCWFGKPTEPQQSHLNTNLTCAPKGCEV